MTRRGTPEADLQRAVVQALRIALPRTAIIHHCANEVTEAGPRGAKRQAILVGMGVHAGFADLMVICDGRVLFLELKAPKGRLRPDAGGVPRCRLAQGFGWALVRSLDDALGALADHGFTSRASSCPAEARAMSHKATVWAIQQRGLKPTTKIVLWHLCDRHNPDFGCFPSQAGWRTTADQPISTLNEHLGRLEELRLIHRVPRHDPVTQAAAAHTLHPGVRGWFTPTRAVSGNRRRGWTGAGTDEEQGGRCRPNSGFRTHGAISGFSGKAISGFCRKPSPESGD
jgi:hypothetical protein